MTRLTRIDDLQNGTLSDAEVIDQELNQILFLLNGLLGDDNIADKGISKGKLNFSLADPGFKKMVATFSDLATSYPSPADGDIARVQQEGAVYMYDATARKWNKISGVVSTVSHNTLDGRTSPDAHPISSITGLSSQLSTMNQAITDNNTSLDGRLDTAETTIANHEGRIDTAEADIAENISRLDTVTTDIFDLEQGKLDIGAFGIGGVSVLKDNTDINTLNKTGFYSGGTLTNSPTGEPAGYIIHIEHGLNDGKYCIQFFHSSLLSNDSKSFKRRKLNGTWQAWELILDEKSANRLAYQDRNNVPFGEFYTSASSKVVRTTDGAWNNILWDTTKTNNNAFYTLNATTGYITIPEEGLYDVEVRIRISTVTNANTKFKMHIHNNGAYLKTLDVITIGLAGAEGFLYGKAKVVLPAGALLGVRFGAYGAATALVGSEDTAVEILKLTK